jgi:hypothetical protein
VSSDFVPAKTLKQQREQAEREAAAQRQAEEAAAAAHEQAAYEQDFPRTLEQMRPYIREVFKKAIAAAMELPREMKIEKELIEDPKQLIRIEKPYNSRSGESDYGKEYGSRYGSEVGRQWDRFHVKLTLDMGESYYRTDHSKKPWGEGRVGLAVWQAVTEELALELAPLDYQVSYKYLPPSPYQFRGSDESAEETLYTNPSCLISIEW